MCKSNFLKWVWKPEVTFTFHAIDFSGVITLNEVGAFIWKVLENGASKEEILEKMLSEYDVDKETAKKDIDEYIQALRGAELIED